MLNIFKTLENFPSLPAYHTRTLLLSSPGSCAEFESEHVYEWVIEFSPKGNYILAIAVCRKGSFIRTVAFYPIGVWFRSCCLIVWQGNIEVPETVLRTVRLSLTLKVIFLNPLMQLTCLFHILQLMSQEPEEAHVRVAVLVYGKIF